MRRRNHRAQRRRSLWNLILIPVGLAECNGWKVIVGVEAGKPEDMRRGGTIKEELRALGWEAPLSERTPARGRLGAGPEPQLR